MAEVADAVALAGELQRSMPGLAAAELFFDAGLELVVRHMRVDRPFGERHRAYLLLEADGDADPTDLLAEAIAQAEGVDDAVVAGDEAGRARLWALRERHTESIGAEGVAHKLDVAVPVARLAEFVTRVGPDVEAARPGSATYLYGHVCEGNLHVGVIGPAPDDEAVDDAVLRLTIELGGSVSAEHGVGVAKVGWLEADRGAADVAAMRAIKQALDPRWMLNPGVLLREGG
jgi:FAD/FMN-containing dehydrogenase